MSNKYWQDTDGSFHSKFGVIFALLYRLYRRERRKLFPLLGFWAPVSVGVPAELGGAVMMLVGRGVLCAYWLVM